MKNILLAITLFVSLFTYSQNSKTINLIKDKVNKWEKQENNTYSRTWKKDLNKLDEKIILIDLKIAIKKNAFTHLYLSTDNEFTFIGNMLNIHTGIDGFFSKQTSCATYIGEVEVKGNSFSITYTLLNIYLIEGDVIGSFRHISNAYPFYKDGKLKNFMGKTFYKINDKLEKQLNVFYKDLKIKDEL